MTVSSLPYCLRHLRPPPPKPTALSLSRGSEAIQTLLSSCRVLSQSSNLPEVGAALLRALGRGKQPGAENPRPRRPRSLGRRRAAPAPPASGPGTRQGAQTDPAAGTQPCSSVHSLPPTAEMPDWPTKPKTFSIASVLTPGLGCQQPCPPWAVLASAQVVSFCMCPQPTAGHEHVWYSWRRRRRNSV